MLETEANEKLCPVMTNGAHENPTACAGRNCMAWEVWVEPIRDEATKTEHHPGTIIGQKPKEPPEGHCGMIPPELFCER